MVQEVRQESAGRDGEALPRVLDRTRGHRRGPLARVLPARKPDHLGHADPAAIQLRGRNGGSPGIRRIVAGPVPVYRFIHRGNRSRRDPCRKPWANRGFPGFGGRSRAHAEPGGHSPGPADHRSPADQPVPEPDQELVPGDCDRVYGYRGNHRRHFAQPDRPGDGMHDHRTAAVPGAFAADIRGNELVQQAYQTGRAVGDRNG